MVSGRNSHPGFHAPASAKHMALGSSQHGYGTVPGTAPCPASDPPHSSTGDPTGNFLLCTLYPKSTKRFFPATSRKEIQKQPGFLGSKLHFGEECSNRTSDFHVARSHYTTKLPKKNRTGGKRRKIQKKEVPSVEGRTDGQEMQTLHPLYPHVILLHFQLLVVDGWGWQLGDEGLGLLNPWVQLLVGLPKLVDQDLGTLQASVTLRVELAHGLVLLHQGLGFLLKKQGGELWGGMQKSPGKGPAPCCELEEKEVPLVALHAVIPVKAASGISPSPSPNLAIKIGNKGES